MSVQPVNQNTSTRAGGSTDFPGFVSPNNSVSPTPSISGIPSTGVLDSTCMSNPNYDTCVFKKNPVAQNGASLSPALSPTSNLASLLIYGVKLAERDSSGYLQNTSFAIYPSNPSSTKTTQLTRIKQNSAGNWKYPFSSGCTGSVCIADPNHNISQLMAFYWLNFLKETLVNRTGTYYPQNNRITVITSSPKLQNAYWDGSKIVLGDGYNSSGTSSMGELALSADIYIHEMGHANLDFAAPSTALSIQACSGDPNNDCCSSEQGCIGAIHEGQADYLAGMIFPEGGGVIGESFMNSINGLTECGLSRTIGSNKNLTATQAYRACGSGSYGEIHLAGRVYASIWWEVRNRPGNNAYEIDELFQEHLNKLQGSDTFVTALDKIKATDQALFNSKYSQNFSDEFKKRGL